MNDDQNIETVYYVLEVDRASGEFEMHMFPTLKDMAHGAEALKPTLNEGDVVRLFKQVDER